eukprot:gene5312-3814_t
MTSAKKSGTIYDACRKGDAERVKQYISQGGCVTEGDENKMTMLHHLAFSGKVELVKLLLEAQKTQNVDLDASDNDGWTPLHYAADRGHADVVRFLLEEGASVGPKDSSRRTPLHLAALGNRSAVVEVLIVQEPQKRKPLYCCLVIIRKASYCGDRMSHWYNPIHRSHNLLRIYLLTISILFNVVVVLFDAPGSACHQLRQHSLEWDKVGMDSLPDEVHVGNILCQSNAEIQKKEVLPSDPLSPSFQSEKHFLSGNDNDTLLIDWMKEQSHSAPIILGENEPCMLNPVEHVSTKKRKRGKDDGASKTTKRSQKVVDVSREAFRQSQRVIRRESKHMSMKDVLRTTVMSPSSFSLSQPAMEESFPNSSPTASMSSIWSPQTANDITTQFLSSVEASKRRRFERIVTRETGNSQSSLFTSPVMNMDFVQLEEELVIFDENANSGPPAEVDVIPQGEEWERSIPEGNSISAVTDPYQLSLKEEKEEELEKQRIDAISRKHKIWELRQQRKRAEIDLEQDSLSSKENASPTFSAAMSSGIARIPEAFTPMLSLHTTRHANDLSISESRLSHDDISMIKRINSFDKTSSQRVVVFAASGSTKP